MANRLRLTILISLGLSMLDAADWPMAGFDTAGSNTQPDEKTLSATNIKGLTLLWSKHLGPQLSSPVIVGRVITHRGFQELVFVTSSDDRVTAVDADLGRILWQRKLSAQPDLSKRPVTPAFVPVPSDDDDSDDDDLRHPLPLFALSSHSVLFALKTISGEDDKAPVAVKFPECDHLTAAKGAIMPSNQRTLSAEEGSTHCQVSEGKIGCVTRGQNAWSRQVGAITAPLYANGLIYLVAKNDRDTRLLLLAANSGQQALSLPLPAPVNPAATMALANGHVALSTSAGDLLCFGLPVDL